MVCGVKVGTIAWAVDYNSANTTTSLSTGGSDDEVLLPEYFMSGNLLAHHRYNKPN